MLDVLFINVLYLIRKKESRRGGMTTTYQQGIDAHRAGLLLGDCPYSPVTEKNQYDNWRNGWLGEEHAQNNHSESSESDS
jgi:hypothetical protein